MTDSLPESRQMPSDRPAELCANCRWPKSTHRAGDDPRGPCAIFTPEISPAADRPVDTITTADVEAVARRYDEEYRGGIGRGDIDTELAERLAVWFNAKLVARPAADRPVEKVTHALGAIRKAAGWAYAEGMTRDEFLTAADAAFSGATESKPHV